MKCTSCGNEYASEGKLCPACQSKAGPTTTVIKRPMPLWFKIVVALTLFALVLASAGLLFAESLVDVAEKQLETLRKGEIEKAYQDYTSTAFKQATSASEFKEFIAKFPILTHHQSSLFDQRSIKGNITVLKGKLSNGDRETFPIEYRLINEDGQWKVLSLRVLKSSQIYGDKKELVSLAKNHLKAIGQQQSAQSYQDHTSKRFQEHTDETAFKEFVDRYPILTQKKTLSFYSPTVKEGKGKISVTLQNETYSSFIQYDCIEEDSQWKILKMTIFSPTLLP